MSSSADAREPREVVNEALARAEQDQRERTRSPSVLRAAEKRVERCSAAAVCGRFLFENGLTIAMPLRSSPSRSSVSSSPAIAHTTRSSASTASRRSASVHTSAVATSSRRRQRTGNPSSCRWDCSCC